MNLLRWAFIFLAAAVLSGSIGPNLFAQTVARYEATAAIAREGADAGVAIDILRWSTEEEVEEMMAILQEDPDGVAQQLRDGSTLGYVWTAESVGYSIRFATLATLEGGGERIVLALNERFASRNPTLWSSELTGDDTFTLIEVRMSADGRGEGRHVLPTATAYAFGMDGYELSQVVLENVTLRN